MSHEPRPPRAAQDVLILDGHAPPFWHLDTDAAVNFTWRRGRLVGERAGPCLCPRDTRLVVSGFANAPGLLSCAECLRRPGRAGATVLHDVPLHRRVELLGVHFQKWKRRPGWSDEQPDDGTAPAPAERCAAPELLVSAAGITERCVGRAGAHRTPSLET